MTSDTSPLPLGEGQGEGLPASGSPVSLVPASPLPSGEGRGEGIGPAGGPTEEPTAFPSESPGHAEGTAWFATVLAHGAATMFFTALAFAAGWYRLRGLWPPPSSAPGVLPPTVAGLLLLGVAPLLHWASRASRVASAGRRALPWLLGALAMGGGFLATQAAWLHVMFWERNLRIPEGGAFASAFYGLSAMQALHTGVVLAGVFLATVRLARGADVRASLRRGVLGACFAVVTYALLFVAVYL